MPFFLSKIFRLSTLNIEVANNVLLIKISRWQSLIEIERRSEFRQYLRLGALTLHPDFSRKLNYPRFLLRSRFIGSEANRVLDTLVENNFAQTLNNNYQARFN